MKQAIRHGIVSLLLALGLVLAVLACMDMLAWAYGAAAAAAGVTLLLTLASPRRLTGWLAAGTLAGAAGLWLLLGGIDVLTEILRAMTLHFGGVNGALPMVALQASLLLGFLLGAVCFGMTSLGSIRPWLLRCWRR